MAKIQVILLEDVAGQGRKGDLITVSDGYAHNFLIKNKKGVLATKEELDRIERNRKKELKRQEEEKEQSIELKKFIESKELEILAKTGQNGKLFGSITNKEISSLMKEELGISIDRKKIECNIKSLGEQQVIIKLHSEVKATLKVVVKEQ